MRQVLQSGLVKPTRLAAWVADDIIKDAGLQFVDTFGVFVSTITAVNFNAANNDNPIPINLPHGHTLYRIAQIIISGASASLAAGTCGIFTQAGGLGLAVISSQTPITITQSANDTNFNMQLLPIVKQDTMALADSILYFRTQVPAMGTANVSIFYSPLLFTTVTGLVVLTNDSGLIQLTTDDGVTILVAGG